MAAAMTCTNAGLQQNNTGVSSQSVQQHQAGDSTSQARSTDAKGNLLPQMPLPCPGMPPFLIPPFGRMPFPMLPMMPGMLSPVGNNKGIPPMPMMFPHPAQLQAMSQAAQAAMAQAAKQPGTLPPFPMGMMPPMPMMMQPVPPGMQSSASQSQQGDQSTAVAGAAPGQLAGQAAAAAADDDADDDRLDVDEDVEVEPELEQIFEKVAALEREKVQQQQQQERASSPCTSIHSAATGQATISLPCSPTAGVAFTQPAAAPAAAGSGFEAAPVPWLSFAADDKVDNLDDDLAQIITLPDLPGSSNGSHAGCASPVPAAAGKPNTYLKRVSSTGSAYSTGDALTGAAAALATNAKPAAVSNSSKPKVLRIRSIKGCGSAAISASKAPASSKSGSKAPAAPGNKAAMKSSSPQRSATTTGAAAGLGAAKAGVQKKASTGSNSSKAKGSKAAAQSTSPTAMQQPQQQQQQQQKIASPAKQQPATDDLDLLGDLAELESGFSDTCFGSSGDDMGIDSFDFMGELLQESSEDAWDGLLGMAAADIEL